MPKMHPNKIFNEFDKYFRNGYYFKKDFNLTSLDEMYTYQEVKQAVNFLGKVNPRYYRMLNYATRPVMSKCGYLSYKSLGELMQQDGSTLIRNWAAMRAIVLNILRHGIRNDEDSDMPLFFPLEPIDICNQ